MQVHEIENALTENISHIRILLSSAKSNCLTELLMVFHGFEYILEEEKQSQVPTQLNKKHNRS